METKQSTILAALMLAGKEDGGHGGVLLEKKVESFCVKCIVRVRLIILPLGMILALGCIL